MMTSTTTVHQPEGEDLEIRVEATQWDTHRRYTSLTLRIMGHETTYYLNPDAVDVIDGIISCLEAARRDLITVVKDTDPDGVESGSGRAILTA
jgi:hypothetical protein